MQLRLTTTHGIAEVVNDIITSMCHQQHTVLLSLGVSAAFDTVDHSIVIDRITGDFDITGIALSWLQSFLSGRSQYVGVGDIFDHCLSLHLKLPKWYLTALLQLDSTTATLCHMERRSDCRLLGMNCQGSLSCSEVRQCHTELRRQLHWLPMCQRINYKLALLTYKTRSTGTPAYTWRLYWKVTGHL